MGNQNPIKQSKGRGGKRPGAGRKRKATVEAQTLPEHAAAKPEPTPEQPELVKRKVGRPSLYNPDMCDQLIDMGAQGFAVVEMAVGLGIRKSTLYEWAKDEARPEFADALAHARELSESYHAKAYREGCTKPASVFNAQGYAKYMGIVFADWREVTRTEVTGADGGPIETKEIGHRELAQRAAFVLKRGIETSAGKPH